MANHNIRGCTNCGGKEFTPGNNGETEMSGIITVRKDQAQETGLLVDVSNFIPVRVYMCNSCSHVEIFYNPPQ